MENNTIPTPDATDVANNKVMAVLSYFWILFLVPLFAAKDSPYARFHANQGCVLFICNIVLGILVYIPYVQYVAWIGSIVTFVFFIMGVINAATGKMKELPLIGGMRIIK